MTRIDDVARATGVSTATVSRALRGLPDVSEATRHAVIRAAAELRYVPSSAAAGLASGRTQAIGVVVPSFTRWFCQTVLEGIDSELRASGYDLIVFNLGGQDGERERTFHRSILRRRTDALVALCLDFSAAERDQLRTLGHPMIVVGGKARGLRSIGIDERSTARKATEHLVRLGHTDIAHLSGRPEHGLNALVPLGRERGYQDALAAAGIPLREDRTLRGDFTLGAARAAMDELLAAHGPHPTAVFASSDEMAIGAILAIRSRRLRVPEDISVIGIDGDERGRAFGLTTFSQDPAGQGRLAVQMLLAELGGGRPRTRSVQIRPTLVERASVGRAPTPASDGR